MLSPVIRSCRRSYCLCKLPVAERILPDGSQFLIGAPSFQETRLASAAQLTSLFDLPTSPTQVFGAAHYASKAGKKKQGQQIGENEAAGDSIDLNEVERSMQRPVEHLQATLSGMRTGRASPGMLDLIKVEVYGERMPLKGAASVAVRDSQLLTVSVFDPSTQQAVEKAIRDSSLGLSPRIEQGDILVPVPRPTKETLEAMAKLLKKEGELAKVSIRQARKNVMDTVKKLSGEDDRKKAEKQVQTVTDSFIKEVDSICAAKEKDLKSAM